MLDDFDNDTLSAAVRLQTGDQRAFDVFIAWLKAQKDKVAYDAMYKAPDDRAVRCNQGAFQALDQLIGLLVGARDELAKRRESAKSGGRSSFD